MSSAALLLLIPLAWLAVTLLVVAACRVTARAEAEGPRPPDGGAGGLSAVSTTTPGAARTARRPLDLTQQQRLLQLPATFTLGGTPGSCQTGRIRRQPTDRVPARSR
jgi:hypothetical protein